MNFKKIKNISIATDNFYHLVKRSVPLDEVIFTPQSDYYDPNPDFSTPRKSRKREMDLPPIQEFKSHFQNTNIKYRIIYSSKTFGLTSGSPVDIERYKSMLQMAVEGTHKKYSNQAMEEAEYLLEHVDTIFNPEAINIIANKYESDDLTGPKGIDHDLGHAILDLYGRDFKTKNMIEAMQKDYKIITDGSFGTELEADFDNFALDIKAQGEVAFALLTTMIAINNLIPGSISEMNIKNKDLSDLFSDLMITYNLQGQSLKNINLNGITLYSNNLLNKFSLEPSEGLNVRFEPKNLNIPNIKEELNKLFIKLEKIIKISLQSFVGKVISLW